MLLSLVMFSGVLAGVAGAADWECISDRNSYRVAVYVSMSYYPAGGCTVNWRFENQNDYPVKVEVTDKRYEWRRGSKFISNSYQTSATLGANETRNGGGGDSIDRSADGGDATAPVRVENFKLRVVRIQ
jgi:hypothetical protein